MNPNFVCLLERHVAPRLHVPERAQSSARLVSAIICPLPDGSKASLASVGDVGGFANKGLAETRTFNVAIPGKFFDLMLFPTSF